ncbi:riboflavin synthase [Patescibacteria group bacterium]|nr:riboflavin synthase [Patescibacteria group bacterium]MBU1015554.1 riboflavin synthase [Patescibacteria group bacterium]MBU1685605.1 riboflavin synthase [Patescibacteria group bacterium]MBU1938977.1 riboflavin synthase [Patescibacteria group bacterium]
MFTGIIENTGEVNSVKKNVIIIKAPELAKELKIGSSISVDGACLTVTKKDKDSFEADVMPITFERTTLGLKKKNDLVNLELAILGSKRFEGHIVAGHVEGTAELLEMKIVENAYHLTFRIPENLSCYVVQTGSIAINGISLTVMDVDGEKFSVGIIPHTWENTNLHTLKVGDRVNIETDILAKYAEKIGLTTKN